MKAELTIRPATKGDLPVIQKLATITFTATFSPYRDAADVRKYCDQAYALPVLTSEIAEKHSQWFVALIKDQAVGYLKLNWDGAQTEPNCPEAMEIQRIYVLPDYQHCHIGSTLMKTALHFAAIHGFETIWLGVWENNQKALSFYRSFGFKHVSDHTFVMGNHHQRDYMMVRKLR